MGGWNRGKGKVVAWLRENASHVGQNCLKYPFPIDPKLGYALFGLNGKLLYAHRFMCELKNGPAPSPKHEAAHTCGNAHMGCINPNHLEWKTRVGNAQDRKRHGNYQDRKGKPRFVLTLEQVEEIKSLKGIETQFTLAERFGVSRQTISGIHTGVLYISEKAAKALRRDDVLSIISMKGKRPAIDVARDHSVSHSTICRIWSGNSHQHFLK